MSHFSGKRSRHRFHALDHFAYYYQCRDDVDLINVGLVGSGFDQEFKSRVQRALIRSMR